MIQYKTSALGTSGKPVPDASGTGMIEVAAPSGALAVAGGSLPVSSAKALCRDWKKRVKIARDLRGLQHKQGNKASSRRWRMRADAIEQCMEDLRREMARATERQPEENIRDEPRAKRVGSGPWLGASGASTTQGAEPTQQANDHP